MALNDYYLDYGTGMLKSGTAPRGNIDVRNVVNDIPLGMSLSTKGSTSTGTESTDTSSTTKGTQTSKRTETGQDVARTTGTVTDEARSTSVRDNLDAASRQAYNQLLRDLTNGGTAEYRAQKLRELQTVQDLVEARDSVSGASIEAKTTGDIAAINRNLTENVLPKILASQEQGGSSFSALTSLLAQDAAVKTAEASARVMGDARNAALSQQMAIDQTLLGTTGKEDFLAKQTMQLLDIGRQAYEKVDNVATNVKTTNMTTVTDIKRQIDEVLNSSQSTTGTSKTSKSGSDTSTVMSAEGRDPLMDAMTKESAIQNLIKSGAGTLTSSQNSGIPLTNVYGGTQGYVNELQRQNVMWKLTHPG